MSRSTWFLLLAPLLLSACASPPWPEYGQAQQAVARAYAAQLPHARLHLVPGEGHFSMPPGHRDEILAELRSLVESTGSGGGT